MTSTKTADRAMSAPSSRIVIVRVELTPDAKQKSADVATHFGMTQIATLSRLVE